MQLIFIYSLYLYTAYIYIQLIFICSLYLYIAYIYIQLIFIYSLYLYAAYIYIQYIFIYSIYLYTVYILHPMSVLTSHYAYDILSVNDPLKNFSKNLMDHSLIGFFCSSQRSHIYSWSLDVNLTHFIPSGSFLAGQPYKKATFFMVGRSPHLQHP